MVKHNLKVLLCKYHKIFTVCLAIFQQIKRLRPFYIYGRLTHLETKKVLLFFFSQNSYLSKLFQKHPKKPSKYLLKYCKAHLEKLYQGFLRKRTLRGPGNKCSCSSNQTRSRVIVNLYKTYEKKSLLISLFIVR